MHKQLVLQWSTNFVSYELLMELENALIDELGEQSVDGHDAGEGEMNIFILTSSPSAAFAQCLEILKAQRGLLGLRAAWREIGSADFHVLWPEGLRKFEIK